MPGLGHGDLADQDEASTVGLAEPPVGKINGKIR